MSKNRHKIIINYVPLWISPKEALKDLPWDIDDFTSIEVTPETYQEALKEYNKEKGLYWDFNSEPTIALKLSPSIHDKDPDGNIVENFGNNRCQALLLALFLVRPVWFAIPRIYFCKLSNDFTPHFYGYDQQLQCQARWVDYEKYHEVINSEEVSKLFGLVQEYFRIDNFLTGKIRADRISIALNALWASLNTEDWRQAYISRTVIMEAILSEGGPEIAHQIAERAVLLLDKEGLFDKEGVLGKECSNPLKTYKNLKTLYSIRSNIVHGRFKVKKHSIIAFSQGPFPEELHQLTNMSRLILRHAILNNELRKKLQDTSNKSDNRLRDYFLELQFGPKEEGSGK